MQQIDGEKLPLAQVRVPMGLIAGESDGAPPAPPKPARRAKRSLVRS
jgi:hypothetical protein